jgi:FemAB-related protein (PEP-CTERM system-associated)
MQNSSVETNCVQIRYADASDWQAWDGFVQQHPDGTIFHLSSWKTVVERAFNHKSHYLLATSGLPGGEIAGVLPLFEIKSLLFGHFLVSVPFAELGGVLASSSSVSARLLEQAAVLAEQTGAAYVELKNCQPLAELPTKSLYYNFSRPLCPTPEENLQAIPRKSRAMVRKGIQAGLYSEVGKDLFDDFYQLLARSYHQLGTPVFPRRFLAAFLEVFGDRAEVLIVRTAEGQPVAGVMSFYYQDRVMPYYAGSLHDFRHLAPNDFMYWELMRRGCERGCKVFDFGRSKQGTGSFAFKEHWGFEPRQLAYQYRLNTATALPDLSPANPKYRKKIELWRKLPFVLTKLVGPPLAKYLA